MRYIIPILIYAVSSYCSDDAAIAAAENLVASERAKIAIHINTANEARVKLSRTDLTPQERLYYTNMVASQQRYTQEAHTKTAQAVTALVNLRATIKARTPAQVQTETSTNNPTVTNDTKFSQAITPSMKLVTLNDGTTIEILRFVELESEYSIQTPDKKFRTINKDTVKKITDKVSDKITD